MQARRLPARHGFFWLLASFHLFRANPPLLTALTMAYLFLIVAINLLPLFGPFLVPLVLPALIVVLANGCRAIERGGGVGTVALTFGLQQYRGPLLQLGGLHLIGSMLILATSVLLEGGQPAAATGADQTLDEQEMIATLLRLMIIALPVLTAFWFAPLLTVWDKVEPLKSVFFSFIAVWRNWQAFAVYGLTVVLIAVILPGLMLIMASAISPVLLNVLAILLKLTVIFVVAPTLMASVYMSYRDVFHGTTGE